MKKHSAAKQYGTTILLAMAASVFTFAAIRSEQLVAWALEGRLLYPLRDRMWLLATGEMAIAINDIGWWLFVAVTWVAVLCSFMVDYTTGRFAGTTGPSPGGDQP